MVQYLQAKKVVGDNNIVTNEIKTAFITSMVIGIIGMGVFAVLINMLFSSDAQKMNFNMAKVMLSVLGTSLLIASIVSVIYGILIVTKVVPFYTGTNKQFNNFQDCRDLSDDRHTCGMNFKVAAGLLIGFGLIGTLIFGNLFRKYILRSLLKVLF